MMKGGKDHVVCGKPSSKFIGNVLHKILPDTANPSQHAGVAEQGSGCKS